MPEIGEYILGYPIPEGGGGGGGVQVMGNEHTVGTPWFYGSGGPGVCVHVL